MPEKSSRVPRYTSYPTAPQFGPAVDAGFRALAKERRARDPVRFFVKLPLRRAEVLWMRAVPDWEMPIVSPTLALPERRDGLVPLTRRTLLIPNTHSATGILYAATILVFIGELCSRLLSVATTYPV